MDFWKTDNENGSAANAALGALQEFMDSPNISRDSIEDSSDDPNEPPKSKDNLLPSKASILAKKRLQAYSANNKLKPKIQDCKDEVLVEQSEKKYSKKTKKSVYPDDAAKAVIRDIEELKKAGFGGGPIIRPGVPVLPPLDSIPIPLEPIIPISLSKLKAEKSPALSLSSDLDDDNLFKKREIKCRNIRRSESFTRRSSSPKPEEKKEKHSKKEVKYPSNWKEYTELDLNPREDALLKAKLFKKPQDLKFDYQKYLSFESPAVPIEDYKCQSVSGNLALRIPFSYLRCTAAKPHILYSTNHLKTQPGFLTKNQLLSLVPKERRNVIDKLWKTPSKFQEASNGSVTSRKWYPRNWRKFDNNEAKQLEKSVGLSFLQSYSDEVEEDVEEVVQDVEDVSVIKEDAAGTTPKIENTEEAEEINEEMSATPDLYLGIKTPPLEDHNKEIVTLEDEYYKTKKELEMLEASIKHALDEVEVEVKVEKKEDKKKQKSEKKAKKDKKVRKKKNKKKVKKEEVEESESEEDVKKKRPKKAKKDLKKKVGKKLKNSKSKKDKPRKKKKIPDDEEEKDSEECDNDQKTLKKSKKHSDHTKKRTRTISSDSITRKSSVEITQEGYEDAFKFFAAIFDEEDNKGRTKNRLVLNIDDLTAEEPEKKAEVKVDLLKKNEEYMKVLKEQTKDGDKKIEEEKKSQEESDDKTKNDLEEKKEIEATSPEMPKLEDRPNWERLKSKRKRHIKDKSHKTDTKTDKIDPDDFQIDLVKVKVENDVDAWENTAWETDEETSVVSEIPPEIKRVDPEDRLLEIPLIIKPFSRREIKVEPQEEPAPEPQKRSRDLTEEARKLEVEKMRIFQLEKELKEARLKEAEEFDIESPSKRKNRWDIQTSTPLKVKEDVIDLDASNSNASLSLENEYEEFLKAVTSNDGDCFVVEDKPAPVPSPKVEAVLDLHQPLINFSLSANVTQNITLSLSTCSNFPISVSQLCEAPPPPPPPEEDPNEDLEDTPKKIQFTTMTLPTKKLLDNSNLNLDESDNEEEEYRMEELRRLNLEELVEDSKKDRQEVVSQKEKEEEPQDKKKVVKAKKKEERVKVSPRRSSTSRPRRKETPPRRRAASPRRRSPRRSPRRKSPVRRKRTPPKRVESPRKRRRSLSPRRRKIRSHSPRGRKRSVTPRPKNDKQERPVKRLQSPQPKERPKSPEQFKQAADSTISDDQLPQSTTMDDFTAPNVFSSLKHGVHDFDSPKRVPLDVRINQVLGYDLPMEPHQQQQQQVQQQYQQYSTIEPQVTARAPQKRYSQPCYQQVGNVLQIVPNDHPPSQIVQVGNMLEIVPNDMIQVPLPEVKTEDCSYSAPQLVQQQEKPSAEASMLQKVAERRAERENRRKERERKRKEKEKRRKEKERARQAKLKIKTENMIKKALELEQEEDEQNAGNQEYPPIQWPPVPTLICHTGLKEAVKGILTNSSSRKFDELIMGEKRSKAVQFADGVRPGEGTSPSAGEELSSPPPPKQKLPKEKRYKKVKFGHKSSKKKVKVKVIKKSTSPMDTSDSEDNLPPPSPPPGSPPPHIFPPRIKVHAVNNLPNAYLASIIQNAQQQQQQQHHLSPYPPTPMYRPPPVNLIMAPPPPLQGHLPAHHQSPLTASTQSPHFHPGLPPPHPPLPGNSHGHQSGPRHY